MQKNAVQLCYAEKNYYLIKKYNKIKTIKISYKIYMCDSIISYLNFFACISFAIVLI